VPAGRSAKALRMRGKGSVGAVARVEPNGLAVLDDLEAEAVPLGLVQPIFALRRASGRRWGERADKRETGVHALLYSRPLSQAGDRGSCRQLMRKSRS